MTENADFREFDYPSKIQKWKSWLFKAGRQAGAAKRTIKVTNEFVSIPRDGNVANDDRVIFGEIDSLTMDWSSGEYAQTIEQITAVRLSTSTGTYKIDGKRLSAADFVAIREHIFDRIDPELMNSVDPTLWFDLATKYETDGEWELAFRHYKRAAEQLQGHQDGEYAENCIKRLAEKMERGEQS